MAAIIGNGDTMDAAQDSFISSTYWTEGIGPAAALATIRKLQVHDVPVHLAEIGTMVSSGWHDLTKKHDLPFHVGGRPQPPLLKIDHPQATALATIMTTLMLDYGFLASLRFYPMFAHTEFHVHRYLESLDCVFEEMAEAIRKNDIDQRLQTPVKHTGFTRLN